MLSVRGARPDSRLRPFIRAYVQREKSGAAPAYVEPVVARLGATLEFQFADPIDIPIYGVELPNPSVPITGIGPITHRGARMVIQGHVEALTILFEPLGFHALFGTPIIMLTHVAMDGHAVLGRPVSTLYEHLGNTDSFEERTKLLDRFFLRQLVTMVDMDVVDHALTRLVSSEGVTRVRDAAAYAGKHPVHRARSIGARRCPTQAAGHDLPFSECGSPSFGRPVIVDPYCSRQRLS